MLSKIVTTERGAAPTRDAGLGEALFKKPPSRFRELATPYVLMLASGALDAEATERLARIYEALDSVRLNEQIDELLRRVMHYAG